MSTEVYYDREAALKYLMKWHVDEPRESAENLLNVDGYCECCGVDYTRLDRDTLGPEHSTALAPKVWTPQHRAAQPEGTGGRVDFDDDTGTTMITVRVEDNGSGLIVHIDQHNDQQNVIVYHHNE